MSAHSTFWCFEIPIFVQLNGKISGNIHPLFKCSSLHLFLYHVLFHPIFILFNVKENNFLFYNFYEVLPVHSLCLLLHWLFFRPTASVCGQPNIVIMAWQQTVIFIKHSDTDVEGDPVADADCMPILLLSEGRDKSLTVWDSSFVQHSEDCQCWL